MFFNSVITLVTLVAIVDIQELHDVFNEIFVQVETKGQALGVEDKT
jgi:hypothetical protein